jgi:hypothetical protein
MRAKNVVPMGISLPIELKQQIDEERGDIGLSRYILRILEEHYGHTYIKNGLSGSKEKNDN